MEAKVEVKVATGHMQCYRPSAFHTKSRNRPSRRKTWTISTVNTQKSRKSGDIVQRHRHALRCKCNRRLMTATHRDSLWTPLRSDWTRFPTSKQHGVTGTTCLPTFVRILLLYFLMCTAQRDELLYTKTHVLRGRLPPVYDTERCIVLNHNARTAWTFTSCVLHRER